MNRTSIEKKDGESGFTLIEAIISLAILSVGILALFVLITTGIRSNAVAELTTVETHMATDFIERIAYLPYDNNLLKDKNNIRRGQRFGNFRNVDKIEEKLHDATSPEYSSKKGDIKLPDAYQGRYSVSWNVENDYPFPNSKTIMIIVDAVKNNTRSVFRYVKNKR